jgi:hypothetical protein
MMPDGICILAEEDDRVLGFAEGTPEPDMFFKHLLRKHGLSFALAAVPGLLRNPFFVARKSKSGRAKRVGNFLTDARDSLS